jgi:hypothetical protein|tara:strand:+ start:988 stop:1719 length:732 start_codon:yes stop_codon:yes gene_type:complete
VNFPTYEQLINQHCSVERFYNPITMITESNPNYEPIAKRRYNYSPSSDVTFVRLVFLKGVLQDPTNKTLVRKGRFIWCKNLKYEGRSLDGLRQISFTVDKGSKKFLITENNIMCLPAKIFVNNNKYFRSKDKTFVAFSSVFSYKNTISMMLKNSELEEEEFLDLIAEDNPFKPGALVAPRLGYFFPERSTRNPEPVGEEHPCGIILGPALLNDYIGREFYRVRFGSTTYEKIHPIQMEIINEV